MLIEIYTDGRVFVDGQEVTKYKAENILYDYLINKKNLASKEKKPAA